MNDIDQPHEPNRIDDRGLHDLLDDVAGPDAGGAPEVPHDLARARTALRHRRRRAYSLGASGLAAAAVLSIGTVAIMTGAQDPAPTTSPSPPAPSVPVESPDPASPTPSPETSASEEPVVVQEVRLVNQALTAGPYTFGTTPQGWEVQNNDPLAVTIGRIGDPDTDAGSFVGKLVIMLDDLPLGGGEHVTREGRDLVVRDNGDGYTTISVATRPGEPGTTVRIQFPAELGWTRDAALTFLSSVEVGPDALPVVG
ncbi:hypothetical protein EUA93_01970 [Nocardioides oleivorans]|uniref:Uncharacterized protein n=1 Tax=Nocardioides oleivorans TaxID=273676 RepID=A0A4Q2RWT6_9ACTN|nr:hypothetical protein [Nocardioides oleivorans]RYB93226.1 hypothetical protein EUA93_01970 [Nocardioides oleivorans]